MNYGHKAGAILVSGSLGFGAATLPTLPFECTPRHMCEMVADDQAHTREREPAPSQTRQLITQQSTSVSSGTFHVVR